MSAVKEVRAALERAINRALKSDDAEWAKRDADLEAGRGHDDWGWGMSRGRLRALKEFSSTLRRIEKKHSKRPKGET